MACKARLIGVLCAVLLGLAVPLRAAGADEADEATETFNSLYGADLARVRGTGDTRDDVELAVRLLAAAKRASGQPAFLTVLCEKAYDLALRHPTGYGTALAAMDLLARSVPDKADACAARTFEMRQMQYDAAQGDEKKAAGELLLGSLLPVIEAKEKAGDLAEAAALYRKARTIAAATGSPRADEIDARAEALAQQMKTAARIADVKALLARDPANVSAREGLVRIYLVDLDDPAEAAVHLKGAKDPLLLKYVPAAAKGIEAPPELACLELGEWYARLAAKALPHARAPMYARARAYLERFLTLHTPQDLSRTRATLALEKVREAVAKLTARPRKPTKTSKPTKPTETAGGIKGGVIKLGQWVDLVPLVEPAEDAVAGKWQQTAVGLSAERYDGRGRLALPVRVAGAYELDVAFTRLTGDDVVGLVLPVKSTAVALVLSVAHGGAHGLEWINRTGAEFGGNPTRVAPGKLENGRAYRLRVSVVPREDSARVTVDLDGRPLVSWEGPISALSMQPDTRLPDPERIGVMAWHCRAVFPRVRLRMLSGEARLLRPGSAGAGPGRSAPPGPAATDEWTDLLRHVDLAKHAVLGTWEREGSALALRSREECCRVMIPVALRGGYELRIEFVRTSGNDSMGVVLPVGSSRVLLVLAGWGGRTGGLQFVHGDNPGQGQNTAKIRTDPLQNGQVYGLWVKVLLDGREATVGVALNGKPVMQWRGPQSALSVLEPWRLPNPQCLGLGAWGATYTFRTARLKVLSGQAKLVR